MAAQVVAMVAALASAATFGLSTSLQHLVSSRVPETRPDRLMIELVRTRSWLLGMGLSVAAFVFHAVALASGSLVLVQPIIVTGVVFAVLIRAGLDRRRPSRAELGWAAATWAGLAMFLVGTGAPSKTGQEPWHAGTAVAGLLVAAAAAGALARRRPCRSTGKGLWLGVVSGLLFGLVAVLLTLVLSAAAGGLWRVLAAWPLWVMLGAGVCAIVVNQRAYQSTRLSVSMPLLNIVDVLVTLGFAAVVFGEAPQTTPWSLLGQAAGLTAMALAVVRLARLEEADLGRSLDPHGVDVPIPPAEPPVNGRDVSIAAGFQVRGSWGLARGRHPRPGTTARGSGALSRVDRP